MASFAPGRPHKEKVDGVAHRRRRELQVARAEGQACRTAAEALCRDMVERSVELDSAVDAYERRRAELVERETAAHARLAEVLRDRSAAESALEDVRDHAENVLKARRTANTVRAYRLDARWRQLHGRYRGFVVDVLAAGGAGGGAPGGASGGAPMQQLRSPDAPPRPPAKRFGRRFYTAADNLSARQRRESLRTTRSLHTLMAGYLRETSGGGDAQTADRRNAPSRRRSSPVSPLDGAGPERVLDKLRVMQEQCARIAERVRRRSARGGVRPGTVAGGTARPRAQGDCDGGGGGGGHAAWQSDMVAEARQRLTAGRQYVAELRALTDRAVAEAGREQLALRRLLCKTCAACAGGKTLFGGFCGGDGGGGGGDGAGNDSVVQIAGRLERACFALFARLDRMGAGPAADQSQKSRPCDRGTTHAYDVVTSCLLAVQAHRMRTVHQSRDIEHRVHNFHKAVSRLLLATSAVPDDDRSRRGGRRIARSPGHKASPGRRRDKAASATRKLTPRKAHEKQSFVSAVSSPKAIPPAVADAAVESTTVATVKILCPPSIGVIEYE